MCTVTLNIDEALARKVNPRRQSPTAHTDEEIMAIAAERLRLMESGQATYTNGEEGFTLIRNRYGL